MTAPRNLTRLAARVLAQAATGMLDGQFAVATLASERDVYGEVVADHGFDPLADRFRAEVEANMALGVEP